MKVRIGSALVEMLTAAVLLMIVGAISALLVRAQAQILNNGAEHTAVDETLRTTRAIITGELRPLIPRDVHAVSKDSLAIRAFRGWGVVCAVTGDHVTLRYRGLRQPDPSKDSVLIFGTERAAAVSATTSPAPACTIRTGEQPEAVVTNARVRVGAVLLVFEAGSYFLADSALRYRRGSSPKQPLTDQLIDVGKSALANEDSLRAIRFQLTSIAQPRQKAVVMGARARILNVGP